MLKNSETRRNKKAYQHRQNSEVFCRSWMSVNLVHWLWAKALAGFSADRVRRADWKYGAFPPHASLMETMMILYETIMETIWFQIILILTFCLCEVYRLLFLLSVLHSIGAPKLYFLQYYENTDRYAVGNFFSILHQPSLSMPQEPYLCNFPLLHFHLFQWASIPITISTQILSLHDMLFSAECHCCVSAIQWDTIPAEEME